jgi:predicted dehydrogenase
MKTYRIGIVGAGGIVRSRHLPGLRKEADVTIAAVSNSTPQSAEKFVRELAPEAEVVADWQDLVNRDDLDIVWVGATPYLHEPVTVAALRANKHVFCQARMARDAQEAGHMLEVSRRKPELVTMLCPPPQGLEIDAFVRELIDSRRIGTLRHLSLESLNDSWIDPQAPAHWRQIRTVSGNNIMSLGIFVEVLRRWFGDISQVSALGDIITTERGGTAISIPDQLSVMGRFHCDLSFQARWSGLHAGEPVERLIIEGSEGRLILDFRKRSLALGDRAGKLQELATPADKLRPWSVEADFLAAVRNPSGPRPHPDFVDGLAYMRVVDAVTESWTGGGRVVSLPLPNAE